MKKKTPIAKTTGAAKASARTKPSVGADSGATQRSQPAAEAAAASFLLRGKVLVVGGYDPNGKAVYTAVLFRGHQPQPRRPVCRFCSPASLKPQRNSPRSLRRASSPYTLSIQEGPIPMSVTFSIIIPVLHEHAVIGETIGRIRSLATGNRQRSSLRTAIPRGGPCGRSPTAPSGSSSPSRDGAGSSTGAPGQPPVRSCSSSTPTQNSRLMR